jgi:hypothetical protein
MGQRVGEEASDQGASEEAEGKETSGETSPMISRDDADRAEAFECYCGRPLDVAPAIVCSGCDYPPLKCTCTELDDDAETND